MFKRYEATSMLILNLNIEKVLLKVQLPGISYFEFLDRIEEIQGLIYSARKLQKKFLALYSSYQAQLILVDRAIAELQQVILNNASNVNNFISTQIFTLYIFSLDQLLIFSDMIIVNFFFKFISLIIPFIIKKILTRPGAYPLQQTKLEPKKSVLTTLVIIKNKLQNLFLLGYILIFIVGSIIKIFFYFFS